MSSSILEALTQQGVIIAVVGASDNPDKFGHAIYRDLKRKGYRVFPVNPNRGTVDGDRAYPTIQSLPDTPDIVNLSVPPEASLAVAQECLRIGMMDIWLQPGAENNIVLNYLQENGFNYVAGACIMVKTRRAR